MTGDDLMSTDKIIDDSDAEDEAQSISDNASEMLGLIEDGNYQEALDMLEQIQSDSNRLHVYLKEKTNG